jgi:hypothetical protein
MLRPSGQRPRVLAAGAPGPAASSGTEKRAGGTLIVTLLLSAAALDITRCGLVIMTYRHLEPAGALIAAGAAAAVLSVSAARGYRAGRRWAATVALLIGLASGPQASSSGFGAPFTIPDVATAALGVVLGVAILATAGGSSRAPRTGSPRAKSSARAGPRCLRAIRVPRTEPGPGATGPVAGTGSARR